jgi:hypothetical protein
VFAEAQYRALPLTFASWRGPLLRFVVALLFGLWIWRPLSAPVAGVMALAANYTVGALTMGKGGHIVLHATAPARAGADVGATAREQDEHHAASWDTRMTLQIEGVAPTHAVRVSPRRLLYLPLVFYLALLIALPLETERRWRALALGLPLLLAAALVSVWITAAWIFMRVPDLVYPASHEPWLSFLYESWVTPLANKFILPLLLVVAISLPAAAPRVEARAAP